MLSVIIPTINEQFLQKTIDDILEKAEGDIEIIAVYDGCWHNPPLKDNDRLKIVHFGENKGMRSAINAGVEVANGEYIMKCDGHCLFDKGFDIKLIQEHQDNWVQVPRRKRLDAENWCVKEDGRRDIDYLYLSYPDNPKERGGIGLHGNLWDEKNRDESLKKEKLSELISAQGSCWFMKKDYFKFLELMDDKNYGKFGSEFQEIGLKCWLSGGKVIRNKKTYYAHLYKGRKYGRGYFLDKQEMIKANEFTNNWIMNSAWNKQILPFSWLIKKFSPMPTWESGWEKRLWGDKGEPPINNLIKYNKVILPEKIMKEEKNIEIKQKSPDRMKSMNHIHYSSHIPLLLRIVQMTNGKILELGTGIFSTPLLHWLCRPNKRKLVSMEANKGYYDIAKQYNADFHKIEFVEDWDKIDLGENWDVVFIDHEAPRRKEEAKRLANKAKFIILHDTCGRDEKHYHYKDIYPLFKYRYQFSLERPRTSVVSNFVDVRNIGLW